MNMLLVAMVALPFAVFMEAVAWFMHKYVMHGFLWFLHKDHHVKPHGFFEKNDFFFLLFSIPSALCIAYGHTFASEWLFGIGVGQAIYGTAYVLAHDVFIHDRLRLGLKPAGSRYLKAMKRAHQRHHSVLAKNGAKNFGFLWVGGHE